MVAKAVSGHFRRVVTAQSVVPPGVWVDDSDDDDPVLRHADGSIVDTWREDYPYAERLDRPEYEHHKRLLQVELLKLQYWVKDTGQRIVVLFEGRDAAGKGSTIKRFTEHLNPRGAKVVALEVPTERERHQWYFQRYIGHLPTAGEIVFFDRSSWYNRAGVELVMGFATPEQTETFLQHVPVFERMLVDDGIALTKFWFSVTRGEQRTRFRHSRDRPGPPVEAQPDRHRAARQVGRLHGGQGHYLHPDPHRAPWTVVKSNDKKRARLEAIRSLLVKFEYDDKDHAVVGTPDPLLVGAPEHLQEIDPAQLADTGDVALSLA